ncbi:MAG: fimbrillin family protein [Butyricimonas faecalis]
MSFFIRAMNKMSVTWVAIFGVLLAGCSDMEIANVETSSRNVISFNVLSNAVETRVTPINSSNLKSEDFSVFCYTTNGVPFIGCVDVNYNHHGVRIKWYDKLNKWYYSNLSEVHYWPVDVLNFYAYIRERQSDGRMSIMNGNLQINSKEFTTNVWMNLIPICRIIIYR